MKSFDDALNEHRKNLNDSLVNFGEGQRVRKVMLDIDNNSSDYEYYFQAGQQSKQDEVDELQKRIDDALKTMDVESVKSWELWNERADMYEQGASNAYERSYWILKGDQS